MQVKLVDINGQVIPARLGGRIGRGGAGVIHDLLGHPQLVAKIYTKLGSDEPGIDEARAQQSRVEAMLRRPPHLQASHRDQATGREFPQLAWPTHLLKSSNGDPLGFAMPKLPLNHACDLESLLTVAGRRREKLPDGLFFRLYVARNLAALVRELHKEQHYIIDMKPKNMSVYKLASIPGLLALLDADGFSISGGSHARFPAQLFTPEYIAPELLQAGAKPQTAGEAQDRWALAVIIFRLLNENIHPYSGRYSGPDSPTIDEHVEAKRYAYGQLPSAAIQPHIASIHESFESDTRALFDRAFGNSQHDRPTAKDWREHLNFLTGSLRQCNKNEAHWHFAMGCGYCAREQRLGPNRHRAVQVPVPSALRTSRPQPSPSQVPPPPPPPPPPLRPGSAQQSPGPSQVAPATLRPAQAAPRGAPVTNFPPAATRGSNRLWLLAIAAAFAVSWWFFASPSPGPKSVAGGVGETGTPAQPPGTPAAQVAGTASSHLSRASATISVPSSLDLAKVMQYVFGAAETVGTQVVWRPTGVPAAFQNWAGTKLTARIIAGGTYRVDDQPHVLIVTGSAPDEHDCHACSELVSAIVLREAAGKWSVVMEDKFLTQLGAWGQAPLGRFETYGAGRVRVYFQTGFLGQGETSGSWVGIVPSNGRIFLQDGAVLTTGESTPGHLKLDVHAAGATIDKMASLAEAGAASEVRSLQEALQNSVRSEPHGNRKRARELNDQALNLLSADMYAEAVDLFEQAWTADRSDIEIQGNLGYAYLRANMLGDAEIVLKDTLVRAPTRGAAWANLGQLYARKGDEKRATGAFLNLASYSTSPERTRDFLSELAARDPHARVRSSASAALAAIGNEAGSTTAGTPTYQQAERPELASGAALPDARSGAATSTSANAQVIADTLAEGKRCFEAKRYDCAITSAKSVMRLAPEDPEALALAHRAEEAQRKAMAQIRIE